MSVELTGVRPSSAAVCPRMAAYQGLGAPAAPRDPEADGYAERGHQCEQVVVDRLKREGRRVRRQVRVPFPQRNPIATGHADIVLPAEATLVEVHSNTGAKLLPHKALQAAIYACNRRGTRLAYVVAIDPSSLRERWWPVDFEAMRPTVRAIAAAVRTALDGGPLPGRTCRFPGDAPGRWCPFRDECFRGWEWPAPSELLLVDELVEALYDARQEKADAERREREVKVLLAPFFEPDSEHTVGPYRVRRALRPGRSTLSLRDYLAAGHQLSDELAAFVTTGAPSDVWNVTRAEGGQPTLEGET